jgi:hypothetical protein
MPTVRKIVHDAESQDYRFSALVLGIANSTPFRLKRAEAATDPSPEPAPASTTAAVVQ